MSPRPDTFSAAEVARLIGAGKSYVIKQINAGRLPAVPLPRGTSGVKFRVPRSHLVKFLIDHAYPLDMLRRTLNPDGCVLLCRTPPALQAELSRYTQAVQVNGLFELGRQLEARACWAAVVNLPEVGTTEAVRCMRAYHQLADRPELVGLAGEDGIRINPISFDVVLPASTPPEAIARSVLTLRSSTRS